MARFMHLNYFASLLLSYVHTSDIPELKEFKTVSCITEISDVQFPRVANVDQRLQLIRKRKRVEVIINDFYNLGYSISLDSRLHKEFMCNTKVDIYDGDKKSQTTVKELNAFVYDGPVKEIVRNKPPSTIGTHYGYINGPCFFGEIRIHGQSFWIESARKYSLPENVSAILYKGSNTHVVGLMDEEGNCFERPESCQIDPLNQIFHNKEAFKFKETFSYVTSYGEDPNKIRSCLVELVADQRFYKFVSQKEKHSIKGIIGKMAMYLYRANEAFTSTDFNFDGKPDNIGVRPLKFTIYKDHDVNTYALNRDFPRVQNFLYEFGKRDTRDHCLSMLYTARMFDDGAGASYIGTPNAILRYFQGGLCDVTPVNGTSTNVLAVSIFMGKIIIPDVTLALVVTHQLGHSFGSLHDTNSSNCMVEGPSVMLEDIRDGLNESYFRFSTCSRKRIGYVIHEKGGCLRSEKCKVGFVHIFLKKPLIWLVQKWNVILPSFTMMMIVAGVTASVAFYFQFEKVVVAFENALREAELLVMDEYPEFQDLRTRDTTVYHVLSRLVTFFPAVPIEILRKVAEEHSHEAEAIEYLESFGLHPIEF